MSNRVRLCFIVVTYNSQETIRECLDALISQCLSTDEILVHDNGSSDDTVKILKNYEANVSLQLSASNLGFSYACNWCAQQATRFSHLAFINPDAIVGSNLVDRARKTLADGSISLVGFYCKDINGSQDKNFRRYPGVLCGMLTIIDSVICSFNFKCSGKFALNKHYLDGSCMFVDRSTFLSANQFQDFFLYGEDVILCDALKQKSIKAIYHSDVFYVHLRGASSNSTSGERSWSMLPNMVYSELYYLRSRTLFSRGAYLTLKFIELVALALVSQIFFSKNKVKRTFFRKRLLLLCQYSLAFLLQGKGFNKPEFHVEPKKS